MPTNVFGNSFSSYDDGNKFDKSLFVQKLCLRTNYIESNIEKNIDIKINAELNINLIPYTYQKQLQKIMLKISLTILV